MTNGAKLLPRSELDVVAWNACVAASPQRIIYGYSWYLDIVLPSPDWSWMGIVLADDTGQYQAVLPVPLRRKWIAGVPYKWVVHQPFFCQFLDVFSRDDSLDTSPFYQLLTTSFSYGSNFSSRQPIYRTDDFVSVQSCSTHTLSLGTDYSCIYQNYSRDRKLNLRRAIAADWTVVKSSDPEPLLALFRQNHARNIDGGVPEWAYRVFQNLANELIQRRLGCLYYAITQGQIEAGAFFTEEGNRIIYLFNAASDIGRKRNGRTLLIDRFVREKAGYWTEGTPMVLDFESPTKPSIRSFYQSFGAVEEPFQAMCWSRLNWLERVMLSVRKHLADAV
ncbi:GNAT family N-acetyltransferase [Spirosoma gilvum]